MNHLLALLTDNVRNAARKCGASSASVYVPTPWNDQAPGLLVHVGDAPPLPELTDVPAATDFAIAVRKAQADVPGADAMIASDAPHGWLLPIPMLAAHWRTNAAAPEPEHAENRRRLADDPAGAPVVGWLGLRFDDAKTTPASNGWRELLELSSAIASTYVCSYGILTDPVTGLPGRAELNATVRVELERVQATGRPFSLLFIKLEDLDRVNERLGRQAGDAVVRESLEVLYGALRASDIVMRYGGAVLALPLRDVNARGALIVGEKIRTSLSGHRFLAEGLGLPCAVAATCCESSEADNLQPIDLLRRAHQALTASRRERGEHVVLWRPDGPAAASELHDPLLGVFTGHAEKDYRNMRLLWDVLQALSSAAGPDLTEVAIARVFSLFAAARAALLTPGAGNELAVVAGRTRLPDQDETTGLTLEQLSQEERRICERALRSGEAVYAPITDVTATAVLARNAFAVPLTVDRRTIGVLYLQGRFGALIDESDLPVLHGVASHLALALDRERLAEQQRQAEQREQAVLRSELERLRTAVHQARFVFRSEPMVQLLDTTRRVAPTDATVLITGESGTGKEMLAQTLHALSERHAAAFVIVDCGAIPASLMDSELFGRERGAYTGAERRAAGRLAQADRGTIFLDEIGELPLEVQAKLLRFVQEKTITMVGATQSQRVDVRIVAATNRSLEDEVRAGRFREDLFHRLNVVRLQMPPLRERAGDIPLLAQHFLETFAVQFKKPVRGFDARAEAVLLSRPWPGNVRELQNTVLQAVVLSQGEMLSADDLLRTNATATRPRIGASTHPDTDAPTHPSTQAPPESPAPAAPSRATASSTFDEAWERLRQALSTEVQAAAEADQSLPLGRWLEHDVALLSHEWAGRVTSRAARRIGLAETTFSRHLRQAQTDAGSRKNPDSWSGVRDALDVVIKTAEGVVGLEDQLQDLLLALVVSSRTTPAKAAAVLDISAPTLKRRLVDFERRQSGLEACA